MRVKRFGIVLGVLMLWLSAQGWAVSLQALPSVDYVWLGERIERNETGGKIENLTFWSESEEFPSFGIGHFIWFPKQIDVPFESTFSDMVAYVSLTYPAPDWLHQPFAPWANKAEFDQAWHSDDMQILRNWLIQTKHAQAQFIVLRFQQRLQDLIASVPTEQRVALTHKINQLFSHQATLFAMIDYSNFKGFGTDVKERYQQQGWGLLQVLQHMPELSNDWQSNLTQFIDSAKFVLQRRVALAPSARNEARWLPGWQRRLDLYFVH